MKIIRDDKATSVDCFLDKSHRHFHIYAGKTKNGQWKKIRVAESIIPNCITIDTYDNDSIVVGIPKNLLQKGIVSIDLPPSSQSSCPMCGGKLVPFPPKPEINYCPSCYGKGKEAVHKAVHKK